MVFVCGLTALIDQAPRYAGRLPRGHLPKVSGQEAEGGRYATAAWAWCGNLPDSPIHSRPKGHRIGDDLQGGIHRYSHIGTGYISATGLGRTHRRGRVCAQGSGFRKERPRSIPGLNQY